MSRLARKYRKEVPVVNVEIRRKLKPDLPLPTPATDSPGWIVTCATCRRSKVVSRQAVMSGRRLRYPAHAEDEE